MSEDEAYGLWPLVILNSFVFIIFAFSFAKPQTIQIHTYKERSNSMEPQQYQKWNPLALAVASGAAAIIISLLVGLPLMGFGSMMGGGSGGSYGPAWMMGGYRTGYFLGFGVMWIGGAVIAALAGAIVAWVYNAVNATQSAEANDSGPKDAPQLPSPR